MKFVWWFTWFIIPLFGIGWFTKWESPDVPLILCPCRGNLWFIWELSMFWKLPVFCRLFNCPCGWLWDGVTPKFLSSARTGSDALLGPWPFCWACWYWGWGYWTLLFHWLGVLECPWLGILLYDCCMFCICCKCVLWSWVAEAGKLQSDMAEARPDIFLKFSDWAALGVKDCNWCSCCRFWAFFLSLPRCCDIAGVVPTGVSIFPVLCAPPPVAKLERLELPADIGSHGEFIKALVDTLDVWNIDIVITWLMSKKLDWFYITWMFYSKTTLII